MTKERLRVQEDVQNYYDDHPPDSVADLKKTLFTLGSGVLYRKPSVLIPEAGMGLFARKKILKGDLITWYGGPYVTYDEYKALKDRDPKYREYARTLGLAFRQVALGNYRRNALNQLEKVPYKEMDRVFFNDGAAQFINGTRSYADPMVNVGNVCIRGKRRIAKSPADEDRLTAKFPNEIIDVAVALVNIPANTELIISYGSEYFDRFVTESSGLDEEEKEEDDDDDEKSVDIAQSLGSGDDDDDEEEDEYEEDDDDDDDDDEKSVDTAQSFGSDDDDEYEDEEEDDDEEEEVERPTKRRRGLL